MSTQEDEVKEESFFIKIYMNIFEKSSFIAAFQC